MLITEDYKEQQKQLHAKGNYGIVGARYADDVKALAKGMDALTLLDYGCGQQTLSKALPGFAWTNYDPCIEGLDAPPEPADMVVCTDVLEHIEPACLDEVLADLARLSIKGCFMVAESFAAEKTLPDGRNAHLIQEPPWWWLKKLSEFFTLHLFHGGPEQVKVFGVPK